MKKSIPFRLWYYFRVGYGTYLSLPIALASYVTILYQLVIKNVSFVATIFPDFWVFVACAVIILPPTAIGLGWLHTKKTDAFKSEIDIAIEANPYYFKLTPGKERDLGYPMQIFMAKLALKFCDKQHILTNEERETLKGFINRMERLVEGETLR